MQVFRNSYLRLLALAVILVAVLGGLSLITTQGEWYGFVPPGEFHIIVKNGADVPIQGARFDLFGHGTTSPAYGWPIENYSQQRELLTDRQGIMVILLNPSHRPAGGSTWRLFWVFPFRTGGAQYDGMLTASGYRPQRFSLDELWRAEVTDENAPTTTIQINGRSVTLPVLHRVFTLKNK